MPFFQLPDDGGCHWFTDIQDPLGKADARRCHACLEFADRVRDFAYGTFRAIPGATPTTMTKLGKNQHLLGNQSQRVELADLNAAPAGCAFFVVDLRQKDDRRLFFFKLRVQEDVPVGRLHITIQVPGIILSDNAQCQAGGNRSLPRAAFSTANNNFHKYPVGMKNYFTRSATACSTVRSLSLKVSMRSPAALKAFAAFGPKSPLSTTSAC